tara:strand:- start:6 stop:173 length:168 start_codon:yes stop_codon:yes gene_type:complete
MDEEYCKSCETPLLWQDYETLCQGCAVNAELYAKEEGITEEAWWNYYGVEYEYNS